MRKNRQKTEKSQTWQPGCQVTWRFHRQVKNTAVFLLVLMWAFLPLGDYLTLKIGDKI